jgi:hypothetical protein
VIVGDEFFATEGNFTNALNIKAEIIELKGTVVGKEF